jgi:hypothetical protein
VAPEHYVVEVEHSTRTEEYMVNAPVYPSGNPATGPTYYQPAVRRSTVPKVEVHWGDGRVTSGPEGVEGECSHCSRLRGAIRRAREEADEARKGGTFIAGPNSQYRYKLNEIAGWAMGFGLTALFVFNFAGHSAGWSIGTVFAVAFLAACAGAAIGTYQQSRKVAALRAFNAAQHRELDERAAPALARLAELQKVKDEHARRSQE